MQTNLAAVVGVLITFSTPALAERLWCWNIVGTGVSAAGSLTTGNDADALGFFRITRISGTANSAAITALQPAGTAIPGNSGFAVDNLIRMSTPQLSKPGFGFATSDGAYHNVFYLEQYRDYISRPPFANGKGAEPVIEFKAVAASGSRCPTE